MESHDHGVKPYLVIFAALIGLTVLTVAVAFLDVGAFNTLIALAVASLKAFLVVYFFMHVNESSRMVQVFAGAGILWLTILIVITMADFMTRFPVPSELAPQQSSVTTLPVRKQ